MKLFFTTLVLFSMITSIPAKMSKRYNYTVETEEIEEEEEEGEELAA